MDRTDDSGDAARQDAGVARTHLHRRDRPDHRARPGVFDRFDPDRRRHDRRGADHGRRGGDHRRRSCCSPPIRWRDFIERNPTLVMLALAFLVMIGLVLIADGFGFHVPKGYIYAAMGFSVGVELLNMVKRNRSHRAPHEGELSVSDFRRLSERVCGKPPDRCGRCGRSAGSRLCDDRQQPARRRGRRPDARHARSRRQRVTLGPRLSRDTHFARRVSARSRSELMEQALDASDRPGPRLLPLGYALDSAVVAGRRPGKAARSTRSLPTRPTPATISHRFARALEAFARARKAAVAIAGHRTSVVLPLDKKSLRQTDPHAAHTLTGACKRGREFPPGPSFM